MRVNSGWQDIHNVSNSINLNSCSDTGVKYETNLISRGLFIQSLSTATIVSKLYVKPPTFQLTVHLFSLIALINYVDVYKISKDMV